MLPTIDAALLVIHRIVLDGAAIVLHGASGATSGRCPDCGRATTRCHDRYRRRLQDLPWDGRVTEIVVRDLVRLLDVRH